jgi:hypothetical protein
MSLVAGGGGGTIRSLTNSFIALQLRMKQHLGAQSYEHAEALQELDANYLAQLIMAQDENLIGTNAHGQQGAFDYGLVDCFIPSRAFVTKRAWQQVADAAKPCHLSKPIGSIFFSAMWAYYLVSGSAILSEACILLFKSFQHDLKFEAEQRQAGHEIYQKYLRTPNRIRTNALDHEFISALAAGSNPHTDTTTPHAVIHSGHMVSHTFRLCRV